MPNGEKTVAEVKAEVRQMMRESYGLSDAQIDEMLQDRELSRDEATNIVRSIFRRCGYCIAEHGTRGRDLDLVAVPWTDRAGMPSIIVAEVIEALDGKLLGGVESKPHGRAAYAIAPSRRARHDMWYVDLSVVVPEEYRDEIEPRMHVDG